MGAPLRTSSWSLVIGLGLIGGCGGGGGGGGGVELGEATAGLSPDERAAFERGREVFRRRFQPSKGLGPFYNATSCESCHSDPVVGGSAQMYRNFYLAMWDNGTTNVPLPGLPSAVVPAFGAGLDFTLVGERMPIPETVNGVPTVVAEIVCKTAAQVSVNLAMHEVWWHGHLSFCDGPSGFANHASSDGAPLYEGVPGHREIARWIYTVPAGSLPPR